MEVELRTNERPGIHEYKISLHILTKLKKWSSTTSRDVRVIPAIANGMVYFPT